MKLQTRTIKARKIKDKEIVSGVLYGSGIQAVSISASRLDFIKAYAKYGLSKTFEVTLEKEKHIVYFGEVVPDYLLSGVYKHFDLIKVSKDDTLTSKVRVNYLNKDAVKKQGLIINPIMDEVEVEYAVGSGVSFVEVDLKDLKVNDQLKVKDIIAIEGIKILEDPEQSIVSVAAYKEVVVKDPDEDEEATVYADEEEE